MVYLKEIKTTELGVGLFPNVEKRHYPRVNANIDAEVDCGDGFKIHTVVLDTSSTGLKLKCNAVERELLTPRGEWTRNGKPIHVIVNLKIPRVNKETAIIRVVCAVAYSRRVAADCFHIGMHYQNLDQDGIMILGEFIHGRLKQA